MKMKKMILAMLGVYMFGAVQTAKAFLHIPIIGACTAAGAIANVYRAWQERKQRIKAEEKALENDIKATFDACALNVKTWSETGVWKFVELAWNDMDTVESWLRGGKGDTDEVRSANIRVRRALATMCEDENRRQRNNRMIVGWVCLAGCVVTFGLYHWLQSSVETSNT